MSVPRQSTTDRLAEAVRTYTARQDRTEHPDGSFDRKRRWYPSDNEHRACCRLIRGPSASYPYSLMVHCRTAEHIASLYDVEAKDIKAATRKARPQRREGGIYYKAVAVASDGSYRSIYDGETEYRVGSTLVQRVGRDHTGGYYVRRTAEHAAAVEVPPASVLKHAERIVLKVEASGQYTVYPCTAPCCDSIYGAIKNPSHDKLAFSRLTPLEVVHV